MCALFPQGFRALAHRAQAVELYLCRLALAGVNIKLRVFHLAALILFLRGLKRGDCLVQPRLYLVQPLECAVGDDSFQFGGILPAAASAALFTGTVAVKDSPDAR